VTLQRASTPLRGRHESLMGMADLFDYIPHPHMHQRQVDGPPKAAAAVAAIHGAGPVGRFNAALGVKITNAVGSMWTAYLFCLLALVSLPAILVGGKFVSAGTFPHWMISVGLIALVAWIAQTFFQLVLLPIIIVGQNVQAAASDARSQATYDDASAVLEEAKQIQDHLLAQDNAIQQILTHLSAAGPS
jgi:hypothetical protein